MKQYLVIATLLLGCSAPSTNNIERKVASGESIMSCYDCIDTKLDRDTKFAIIGSGSAGLTAAATLRKLGYENVTIFEKENIAGGKVHSFTYEGKTYDMGAVWASEDYDTTLEFTADVDAKLVPSPRVYFSDVEGKLQSFGEYTDTVWGTSKMAKAGMKYMKQTKNKDGRKFYTPGFTGIHPDYYLPMDQYIKKYKIEPIARLYEPLLVGCGYGYYTEVPAMYYLKLMEWLVNGSVKNTLKNAFRRYDVPVLRSYPDGWGNMWREVAQYFNVVYNAEVTKVVRDHNGADIFINNRETSYGHFDKLIIASDLKTSLKFLDDAKPKEKELFSKIEHYNYFTFLVEIDGLDENRKPGEETTLGKNLFFRENNVASNVLHLVTLSNYYPENNIYITYQIAPWGASQEEAQRVMIEDVEKMGGKVGKIIYGKQWRYFPHVKTDVLKAGFYNDIHMMQGQLNTYYVGGIMNFETVEHSSIFAKRLIIDHFATEQDKKRLSLSNEHKRIAKKLREKRIIDAKLDM